MSAKRHKARVLAMQAIYQWQLNHQAAHEVCAQFLAREERKTFTVSFFTELVQGVVEQREVLDERLQPLLGRSLEGLDPVEKAIIRLGAYELGNHLDVPYRVVINEWVEVAKEFGADQGHRFVNGVLDKLAKANREVEIAGGS
ncbi:transcription antitermination factor NusB [Magnetovirga frankeli]|uniref:transcription antitermination factor NusB n=1 Tax=Magnetovirga frankeli TaxID=947516 RepID=UPI0012937BB1|nr:transcription antitermination factor NusB [gamma proteobacterium SS-5]